MPAVDNALREAHAWLANGRSTPYGYLYTAGSQKKVLSALYKRPLRLQCQGLMAASRVSMICSAL